jgi:hypothetical protein
VAPLAGEQILTVLLTVAVHAAEATFAEARRKVAARKKRSEIIRGPRFRTKIAGKRHDQAKCVDIAPPTQAHFVPWEIGEQPLFQGCPGKIP